MSANNRRRGSWSRHGRLQDLLCAALPLPRWTGSSSQSQHHDGLSLQRRHQLHHLPRYRNSSVENVRCSSEVLYGYQPYTVLCFFPPLKERFLQYSCRGRHSGAWYPHYGRGLTFALKAAWCAIRLRIRLTNYMSFQPLLSLDCGIGEQRDHCCHAH